MIKEGDHLKALDLTHDDIVNRLEASNWNSPPEGCGRGRREAPPAGGCAGEAGVLIN